MIMAVSLKLMLPVALAVALAACGSRETPQKTSGPLATQSQPVQNEARSGSPAQDPTSAQNPVQNPVQNPLQDNDTRPIIAAFGDSLTAGFGVEPGKSFPDDLQGLLNAAGYRYHVVNLGVSGDTTTDGLERLPAVLALHPAIVILEFGGNDGLRGLPVASAGKNMDEIVEALRKEHVQVLLAGMTLPRNYGPEYIQSFEQMYLDLAKKYKLARIPFLLEGVGGHPDLMQADGIHPTAEGASIVARNVMSYLQPMLDRGSGKSRATAAGQYFRYRNG